MRWFILLLFLCSSQSFAETSLWRVSNGAHELYIGGTIHVLRASDYPLPSAFDDAFKKATRLVFETDIAATEDPAFGQRLLQRTTYSDGRSLKDGLSRETYRQLEAFCTARGLPIVIFQKMRPPMVVLTLMVLELQRLGISGTGVDRHYFQRAVAANKKIGQLETVTEQLDFMANLGKGREDDFVSYSLRDMQQLETVMDELISAWRTGDLDKMAVIALEEMRRNFPGIYQQLLVNRNHNWLPRIETMLSDPGIELILVGALHLVGDDGVLQLLRERGYRIEQQ
ncbi:TraB/GumN family protein [Beggiatoa alba]|nr:TraB/GumN family protein [Beggiatoa alba]